MRSRKPICILECPPYVAVLLSYTVPRVTIVRCCCLIQNRTSARSLSISSKLIHNQQTVATQLNNPTTAAHLSL